MADTTSLTERAHGPEAGKPARSLRTGRTGRSKTTLIVAAGAILLLALGGYLFLGGKSGNKAGPTAAAGPAPAVIVATVVQKEIRPVMTFTGRVQAIDKVELRARVPGYLDKQLFEDGAKVESGRLMFLIEQAPYQAEVAQMKGTVAGAEADLRNAKAEFGRQDELVRRGYSTPQKLDEARAKLGTAQGTLDRQQAALEQAKINLSYTEVRTPISGRVGQRNYSIGNYVQPSSGTLATVVSNDPIYVMFPVTQRELLDIRRRAQEQGVSPRDVDVRLRLADGQLYDQTGAVDFVDVEVNQATDSVNVRAKFPNAQSWLIDGQLVTVLMEGAKPSPAIVVPQQALQFDQTGYFVLTVDAENKVKVQPVGIGGGYETDVTITSGLKVGDRVITDGVQKVRPGQVVAPAEAKTAAAAEPK